MSKFGEDHERDMADPVYRTAYLKEAALMRARLLLVAFHQAQDECCDPDGLVVDQYGFDRCYCDFGEDALETLELLVDALNDEERPEPGQYGYEAEDGDESDEERAKHRTQALKAENKAYNDRLWQQYEERAKHREEGE